MSSSESTGVPTDTQVRIVHADGSVPAAAAEAFNDSMRDVFSRVAVCALDIGDSFSENPTRPMHSYCKDIVTSPVEDSPDDMVVRFVVNRQTGKVRAATEVPEIEGVTLHAVSHT